VFHVDAAGLRQLRKEIGFFREWGKRPLRGLTEDEHSASHRMNPRCILSRAGCSRAMLKGSTGLCSWHASRLANVESTDCGCTQGWIGICGDATGRMLRRDLFELVRPEAEGRTLIWDGVGLYCCGFAQNTDQCPFRCGKVRICRECKTKHR
jgi:hypothetical protein